jgi:hypothetical protein
LDARASALTGTTKDDFEKGIDGLRDKRKEVGRKLDDLKSVSVDSWMTMKTEVDTAIADLARSYEQVSMTYETLPAAAPGKTH